MGSTKAATEVDKAKAPHHCRCGEGPSCFTPFQISWERVTTSPDDAKLNAGGSQLAVWSDPG